MCTVVLLRRPGHAWPVLLAANRDEMLDRPWLPPARHWPDRAEVVAGLDELAGGTWLGINDHGVVAGILNRQHSLGPAAGMRSRGELVLEALDHADAAGAAAALAGLNTHAYRPFNLIVADNRDGFWLRNRGTEGPGRDRDRLGAGRHLHDHGARHGRHDLAAHARPSAALPSGAAARPGRRRLDGLGGTARQPRYQRWQSKRRERPGGSHGDRTETGFGTVCGSLIALPSPEAYGRKPVWRFAPGMPGEVPWVDIAI